MAGKGAMPKPPDRLSSRSLRPIRYLNLLCLSLCRMVSRGRSGLVSGGVCGVRIRWLRSSAPRIGLS